MISTDLLIGKFEKPKSSSLSVFIYRNTHILLSGLRVCVCGGQGAQMKLP